jgi:hypothetical protein
LAQKKHHHKHHKKDIAERGMDEEVHGFTTANLPPLNTRVRSTLPFMSNGSKSGFEGSAKNGEKYGYEGSFSEKSHHHHKRPDIAERGMDEEVHGFASGNLPPLNTSVRSSDPFVPNGSDPSSFDSSFSERKHHHKHHKKDVAERGMDEEVHGLVWHALPPLNTRVRSDDPFIPNGSDPSAFSPEAPADESSFSEKKHQHKHHKKDVAERGMDEEVHGFVWHALPPLNTWVRSDDPFVPNGSDPSAQDPSFAEHKHHHRHHKKQSLAQSQNKDIISEGGWTNDRVYPYTSSHLPPLSEQTHSDYPFVPNGSDPSAHASLA